MIDSLCTSVDRAVVAKYTVIDGADVLSVPLHVQNPEIAGCEYVNSAGLSGSLLDITVAPVRQSGIDRFAQLQSDQSLTKLNVDGYHIAGDRAFGTIYLRFNDRNRALVSASSQVDSLLTIRYKGESSDMRPLTVDSYSVKLAEAAIDNINSSTAYKPYVDPSLAGKPSPMLTDDQGRPVPNPAEVVAIYDELLGKDTSAFDAPEVGLTAPADVARWNSEQLPQLQTGYDDPQIAKSMTVHPHCDDSGCVYPGFLVTGWSNQAAKDDALKLGVDPAKVQDPRNTHAIPIFASVFPSSSQVGWKGVIPPSAGKDPDWVKDVTVPGDFCGVSGSVHVVNGDSWAMTTQGDRVEITVSDRGAVYGDLLGNGSKATAVEVSCTNGGGTAAGQLGEEYAVFDSSSQPPKLIGAVMPKQPSDTDMHPPLIDSVAIQTGKVVVNERWYKSQDPDCCPSGKATTTWTYHDGQLTPGKPVVS